VHAQTQLRLSKTSVKRGAKVNLTTTIAGTKLKNSKVTFEYKVGKKWIKIATVKANKVADKITLRIAWKAPKRVGKYMVRVRFHGNTYNTKTYAAKRLTIK